MGMDNAEAIKRIKDHIRVHHIGEYPHIKIAEALNMAISALANDNNVGHKVEVVRCEDCKYRGNEIECPMCFEEEIEWDDDGYTEVDWITHDRTQDDGFCHRGERKDND